ncbi:hypothetical protein RJ640_023211 [Escallonia rubra]|uniref:Uncharacterized protein n=1 Tax=Escallonia rubra TaxID=112253 RepID=A0AA88R7N5_9ASTE|nr:hypothetical protein RJ640_023211 [Escallonia rubra]
MALVCALLLDTPSAKRTGNLQQDEYCSPSSCGNIRNITSPRIPSREDFNWDSMLDSSSVIHISKKTHVDG